MTDDDTTRGRGYEVVINPDSGLDKDEAERIRSRVVGDVFRDEAVSVRPVRHDTPAEE